MYRLYHRPRLLDFTALARSLAQFPDFAASTLRKTLYRIRRARQEQIEIRGLAQLDDRLLRDVGVARADIPLVVKAALDAAEAKQAAGQVTVGSAKVSLSEVGLRPCLNC